MNKLPILAITLLLSACSASIDNGNNSASRMEDSIRSSGASQLSGAAHSIAPDATATINDVGCVQTGSTQEYTCIGHYTIDAPSIPLHQKYEWNITGTCDSAGACQWHGQPGNPTN